jgi:hypothetical protein
MKNTSQINDNGSEEYNFTVSNGIRVRQVILKDRTKFVEFMENESFVSPESEIARKAMIEFVNWKNN